MAWVNGDPGCFSKAEEDDYQFHQEGPSSLSSQRPQFLGHNAQECMG